jgi:hypothetical protein
MPEIAADPPSLSCCLLFLETESKDLNSLLVISFFFAREVVEASRVESATYT